MGWLVEELDRLLARARREERAQNAAVRYAVVKPDRESIIKEFDWAINDLDKAINDLYIRLAPVLTPDYLDPNDGLSQPAPETSEARGRLNHLHELTASLRRMTERLET